MSKPLVPPELGRVEFAIGKTVWLYLMMGSSAPLLVNPPGPSLLVVSTGLAFATLCAGHSVGLHRGVIHGTYRCSRLVRGLLVYLFIHTGLGGPLSWIRLHYIRDYYQNAELCPRYFGYSQSVARDYWWNLHLYFVPADATAYGVPDELERDGWLRFLERTWFLHVLGLAGIIAFCFGPLAALTCVSLRVAVSISGHWYIGFMAHKHGYVRYELDGSPEIGRNLPVLGALSFGEGFHNNHHANPGSARMGEAWYEFDLGWYVLLGLERVGIVSELRATGRSETGRHNARRIPVAWRFGTGQGGS